MKKLIIFVSLLFLAMAYGKAEDKEVLKIATFNLRMDTPSDGENAWFHRKDMVNDLIRFYGFALFGTQEGFTHQLNDILRLSDYRFIGVGRDDGKDAGAGRRSRFQGAVQNVDRCGEALCLGADLCVLQQRPVPPLYGEHCN